MMIGWQNLAPEKHRTGTPNSVLDAVARVHPGVWETQETGGDYAYWVGLGDNPRLVGVAWRGDGSWSYAIMNQTAFGMGICCALVNKDGKNRIVPAMPIRPKPEPEPAPLVNEAPPLLNELASRFREPAVRQPREPKAVKKRVYQNKGMWFVKVESKTHLRELGPFASQIEARTRAGLMKL